MSLKEKIEKGTELEKIESSEIIKIKSLEVCDLLKEIPVHIVKKILEDVTWYVEKYSVLPTFYKVHKEVSCQQ